MLVFIPKLSFSTRLFVSELLEIPSTGAGGSTGKELRKFVAISDSLLAQVEISSMPTLLSDKNEIFCGRVKSRECIEKQRVR